MVRTVGIFVNMRSRLAWVGFFLLMAMLASFVCPPDSPKSPINNPYNMSRFHRFSDSSQFKIDSFFRRMYRIGIFNGSYLFYRNDSLLYGSMGYAAFEKKDSIQATDLFQLASVSKIFTGMAVMLLVQDGYLKISDSLHWYIPELHRRNLTIKHLMSHTSGLPDYFYFDLKAWEKPKDHMANQDVVQLLNAQSPTHFAKPGKYDYCNSNFALLSLLTERLSGIDFRRFVKTRIMNPSGMKYSHISNFDSLALPNYPVQGYDNKRVFNDNIFNGTSGDKGVYSNVFEMMALDQMLRTDYMLHSEQKNLMTSPQTIVSADAFYALGWRVRWIDGQKWAFHNGWWKGFRTYFWRCLDENKCYVVLTNNVQGPFLKTIDMVALMK